MWHAVAFYLCVSAAALAGFVIGRRFQSEVNYERMMTFLRDHRRDV